MFLLLIFWFFGHDDPCDKVKECSCTKEANGDGPEQANDGWIDIEIVGDT